MIAVSLPACVEFRCCRSVLAPASWIWHVVRFRLMSDICVFSIVRCVYYFLLYNVHVIFLHSKLTSLISEVVSESNWIVVPVPELHVSLLNACSPIRIVDNISCRRDFEPQGTTISFHNFSSAQRKLSSSADKEQPCWRMTSCRLSTWRPRTQEGIIFLLKKHSNVCNKSTL